MSNNSKKEKQIVNWKFITTEYPSTGKVGVEVNIGYADGSSEHRNLGIFPKDSRLKSAGKTSVANILADLDKEMKEKQRRQQQVQNKVG